MKHLRKSILTLLALTLFGGAGAWAQTEENIFQYCYDCQRSPAYPKTTASTSLSGFANPLVGYNGSGFDVANTSAGPWKLEYVGLWSTTDNYGIEDFRVSNYQSFYSCTDVPVFRLYQWNATANEYQHAAYGVVCAYANVSNAVEHTAFFEAEHGFGCVLTNSSHSSSMNITFDEDLTTGITALIAAATPGAQAIELTKAGANQWTLGQTPDYDLELQVEYYEAHALKDIPAGWTVMVNGVEQTQPYQGDSLMITETDSVTLVPAGNPRRVKSVTLEEDVPPTITVTINQSDWGMGSSFTKDGVTVSAGDIDPMQGNLFEGGTFSTTLGNFTQIVVTTGSCQASGTGWSGSGTSSMTWAGTPASTVSFDGNFWGFGQTQTTIVCTIVPTH